MRIKLILWLEWNTGKQIKVGVQLSGTEGVQHARGPASNLSTVKQYPQNKTESQTKIDIWACADLCPSAPLKTKLWYQWDHSGTDCKLIN